MSLFSVLFLSWFIWSQKYTITFCDVKRSHVTKAVVEARDYEGEAEAIGVLLGVLGVLQHLQAVGEVGNFRMSEILRRRSEIFIT